MAGILKVDQYQDFNGNNIMTSDGSGNVTVNAAAMKNTPSFAVLVGSTQVASANSFNVVDFDTVSFDSESEFNTTNKYYKITETGKYLIQIQIRAAHSNNAQEYHGAALYKDTSSGFGSESIVAYTRMLTAYGNQTYNPEFQHSLSDIISFTNGDYLRVKYYNGSGSGKNISATTADIPRCTSWSMMKVIGA